MSAEASRTEDEEDIAWMLQYVPKVKEIFDVHEKVGEGTFAKVFRATVVGDLGKEYALKYVLPTSKPSRIATELTCLKDIGGSNNVIGIEYCFINDGHIVIVMPYYPHEKLTDYVRYMTENDIREYMRNLFIALQQIHSHGIIHRDIKPNNFLYHQTHKSYSLVDFGLAQKASDFSTKLSEFKQPLLANNKGGQDTIENQALSLANSLKNFSSSHTKNGSGPASSSSYASASTSGYTSTSTLSGQFGVPQPPKLIPYSRILKPKNSKKDCGCFKKSSVCKICLARDQEEAPRGGTPGFRAPEVLLKHQQQSVAIDVWSAGVIMLSLLSKKYPFFRADDDLSALAEIAFLVGTRELKEAAFEMGKQLNTNLPETTERVSGIRQDITPARYLKSVCVMIQHEHPCNAHKAQTCYQCHENIRLFPDSAFHLLDRLLDPNPNTRITAQEALQHPFILAQC